MSDCFLLINIFLCNKSRLLIIRKYFTTIVISLIFVIINPSISFRVLSIFSTSEFQRLKNILFLSNQSPLNYCFEYEFLFSSLTFDSVCKKKISCLYIVVLDISKELLIVIQTNVSTFPDSSSHL